MAQPLVYLLLAFTLLFIIGDLMDNAEEFLSSRAKPLMVLKYYSLQLPAFIILIVPMSLLLATLYSLSTMTRHSEIVAMRASGVSIYRIVRPYMLLGFICFLFTAIVNEYTGPRFAYRANQLKEEIDKGTEEVYFETIAYKNPITGHEWSVSNFDTRIYRMQNITLNQFREDGSNLRKISAKKGQWLDRRWWFEDGVVQEYNKDNTLAGHATPFDTMEMRKLKETPSDFMAEIKPEEFRSSLEQWKYMQTHQHLSNETLTADETDFHHKLTMPFICLIATLIGIPVGAHTGRKGALAGIMMAIGMFFGFYAVQFTLEYFAKQMLIAPWLGAWGSIILFYAIGSTMIYRMR